MDDTEVLASDSISEEQVPSESAQSVTPPQNLSSHESPPASERSRTVPYGALAEERARRKELQRELQESAATRVRLQERLDALHALAGNSGQHSSQGPAGDEIAPADADSATRSPIDDTDAGSYFRTQVLQSVRSYAAERPDFLDAYQHARQARVAELAGLGYTPEEALAITFDNEREVINNAFASGRNPAQVIYDYAVRCGYRSADGPQSSATRSTARPSGGVTALTEAEKIVLAARGQAASKSLSAAGGGATGMLTLEALAGMSDEEFAEATKGERWHRLLRG